MVVQVVQVDALENGLVALLAPDTALPGPKLHNSVHAGVVAWVEAIAFLAETFFAIVLSIACRSLLHSALWLVFPHDIHATTLWDVVWDASFLVFYLLRRSASNFHQESMSSWIQRLGLLPTQLSAISSISTLSKGLIVYQCIGFALFLLWQYVTDDWVLSWSNYYGAHESIELPHLVEILLLSPIKEELVFRGLCFHILHNRLPYPRAVAFVASVLFGCTHLANLKQSKFSTLYVLLQTGLGIEIGYFYALTYLDTSCLFECIVLHVVNNVLSSFTSTQMELTSSPWLAVLLVHSVLLYGVLIWWQWTKLSPKTIRQD